MVSGTQGLQEMKNCNEASNSPEESESAESFWASAAVGTDSPVSAVSTWAGHSINGHPNLCALGLKSVGNSCRVASGACAVVAAEPCSSWHHIPSNERATKKKEWGRDATSDLYASLPLSSLLPSRPQRPRATRDRDATLAYSGANSSET